MVSYGMPAFRVKGTVIAGLKAAKNHVGYYPFSGSVIELFNSDLKSLSTTKSAIHVPITSPLSRVLLKKLLDARISQCLVKRGEFQSIHGIGDSATQIVFAEIKKRRVTFKSGR